MRKTLVHTWFFVLALGCVDRASQPKGQPDATARLPADASGRIDLYVRDNLDAEMAESPVTATWMGVHGYDDRLDDVRIEAQGKQAGRLRGLLERLRAITEEEQEDDLDAEHRVDLTLLTRRAESALYDLTDLRPLERSPVVYLDLVQGGIQELASDETAQPDARMRAITGRLWKVRPLLDEARRNLRAGTPQGVPELLVRRAIELGQAARGYVADTLPKVMQVQDAKRMDDFRAAAGDATRALDDFVAWLAKDLQPRARGELALGRERFLEKLRLVEHVQATAELLQALGERELREARKRYDEAVRAVVAGKPGADAAKLIEEDHGKPDDLQMAAQATVEAVVAFLRAQRLVALPTPERPKVVDMPPALWGFALLDVGAPLERPRDAYLYVDPIVKSWPERRKQEHLRAFNRPVMTVTLLHAYAHYLAAERNRRAPTTMQKIALQPSFIEGWPHYFERMMLDQGFLPGDARARVVVERSIMLRAARLVAVVRLHALGGKIDDVAKLFEGGADLDEYPARREAERAAADPMAMADALGRIEIERLRDDWRAARPDATLGAFHDALLAHGSAPLAVIRRILLPDDPRTPL